MKKILLFFVMATLVTSIFAQNNLPKYQRSSLHMILLNTDEPSLPRAIDFSTKISNAWTSYTFPDKYDQIAIDFKEAYGGAPKGSLVELITKYQGKLGSLGLGELKDIAQTIANNKSYNQQLADTTKVMLSEQKIGQQLLKQWYCIKEDGTYSLKHLSEKAAYNASQSDISNANATVRGLEAITDMAEDLISNTFVSFSKLAFYENEPIAAFSKDLAYLVASFAGPAASAVQASADVAYAETHKGYSAYTTTVLYRLVWNDSIKNIFYSCFNGNKIDMVKFNAIEFPFEFVGVDKSSVSTFDAKGSFANDVGISGKEKPKDELIQETIVRSLDKTFALMQRNYDVFKPLVPIISTEPLLADMGMKESITEKDQFDLLEAKYNEKTGKVEYVSIAKLKVVKGKVWDNRYALTEESKTKAAENSTIKGTELSANKKAALGMVVRLASGKKK